MFRSFFDSESPFSRLLGRLLDIVVLSVLWLVCSLPIVTIGPASGTLLSIFLLEPVFRKYTPKVELDGGMELPWYLR